MSILTKRAALFQGRLARFESWLADAHTHLQRSVQEQSATTARIEALDHAIKLAYPGVNPESAGYVRACERYGERGALRAFVLGHLHSIAPGQVSVAELLKLVIARFGLNLPTRPERESLRRTVSSLLRKGRDRDGILESEERWHGRNLQPLWRWKQAGSLDNLRRAAGMHLNFVLSEASSDDGAPHSNELRGLNRPDFPGGSLA